MKKFTRSEIIKGIKLTLSNAKFFVTPEGDLTMSLDGKFVDHTWVSGTFLNK